MARPVTLLVSQFHGMPFEQICTAAQQLGYDGLELSFRPDMIDIGRAAADSGYGASIRDTMACHGLRAWAVSAHGTGKCVAEDYDRRLDALVPEKYRQKPAEIRRWACEQMMMAPTAARNLGCDTITSFMGSPIWRYFYSFPHTSEEMVEDGFQEVSRLWTPILDEFERRKVKFAFEVHPTEIAYDYYTARRLLESLSFHQAFGFNHDASHLLWQGVDPALFIRDFPQRIFHVHIKDVCVRRDGRAGILGSYLPFGDPRRGWNFRSAGRGDVNFEEIIRALNQIGYRGPLSVEWEDNGMDKWHGIREARQFVRKIDFPPSDAPFDCGFTGALPNKPLEQNEVK